MGKNALFVAKTNRHDESYLFIIVISVKVIKGWKLGKFVHVVGQLGAEL